jgi:hypothetical protein
LQLGHVVLHDEVPAGLNVRGGVVECRDLFILGRQVAWLLRL